jgi:hypothetical protein
MLQLLYKPLRSPSYSSRSELDYLQCHGNLDEPLNDLSLLEESAVLLLDLGVQIAAVAVEHDDVQVAVSLEGLLVRDYIRVPQVFEELSFLLGRFLVALWTFAKVDALQYKLNQTQKSIRVDKHFNGLGFVESWIWVWAQTQTLILYNLLSTNV